MQEQAMARRDLLTYDVGQRRAPLLSRASVRLLGLLAVVVVIGAGLVIWTMASARPAATATAVGPAGLPATTPVPSASQPTPAAGSPSAALVGFDAKEPQRSPRGSSTAAARFIAAWLERDAKARKSGLEQVATAGLAEQLMLTSPANIPKANVQGGPELEAASAYSVQFVQTLTSGMRVRVYLVADPGSRYGWVATSVERA
jgi:hypothetical protein